MNIRYLIALLTFLLAGSLFSPAFSQDAEKPDENLVKRKVLVLPFVDLGEKKSKAGYLSVSIPGVIITSLNKSGSFQVLTLEESSTFAKKAKVQSKDFYNEEMAIKIAKEANADVVLLGNYFVVADKRRGDSMQIQAKVLDVRTGRNRVTVTKSNEVSASVFVTIKEIAREVTRGMVKELPPLTEREVMAQRNVKSGGRAYPFVPNLMVGLMVNYGISDMIIGAGFSSIGVRFFYESNSFGFMTLFLVAELEVSYGRETLFSTDVYYGNLHAGFSYPLKISKKFSFSPYIMGGIFTGIVGPTSEYFLIPSVKPGVNVKFAFNEKKGINVHFSMPYVLDPKGYFFSLEAGVGYAIKF
ncbi:MAG: hypothetical protein ABUK01_01265 [Leptospirales bacterium]